MSELRQFFKDRGQTTHLYIGNVKAEEPVPKVLSCGEFLEDLSLDRLIGVATLATIPLSWTDQAHTKGIPVVGMGGRNPRFGGVVDPDSATAIRDAIHQFMMNGRTRPAFIGWDEQSCVVFNEVLTEVGLKPNPQWTRIGLAPLNAGAGWSDFREIWASSAEKPDCLIFGDDVLFHDACPAIQACGVQIPAELEVVVLANKGIALPQLFHYTRLDCDPREFAVAMGTMLLQLIAGEKPAAAELTIPYRLVTEEMGVEAGLGLNSHGTVLAASALAKKS
jgi:DNA-binding LacI/PurR family transcriptional regulator